MFGIPILENVSTSIFCDNEIVVNNSTNIFIDFESNTFGGFISLLEVGRGCRYCEFVLDWIVSEPDRCIYKTIGGSDLWLIIWKLGVLSGKTSGLVIYRKVTWYEVTKLIPRLLSPYFWHESGGIITIKYVGPGSPKDEKISCDDNDVLFNIDHFLTVFLSVFIFTLVYVSINLISTWWYKIR